MIQALDKSDKRLDKSDKVLIYKVRYALLTNSEGDIPVSLRKKRLK